MTETPSNQGVYFLSLTVENVRCFAEKQTLDLSDGNGRPAQWTVILGDNGTGKTTLLDVLVNIRHSILLQDKLIRVGKNNANAELSYRLGSNIKDTNAPKSLLALESKQEVLTRDISPYLLVGLIGLVISIPVLVALANQKLEKLNWLEKLADVIKNNQAEKNQVGNYASPFYSNTLPILFYSARRRIAKTHKSELNINEDADEPDDLIDTEEWLLQTDYIANKSSEIQEKYQQLQKTVNATLVNLLPEVSDIRISTPSEKSPNPRVEFKLPDGWLLLSQLSLGYQTMTAWMVDLAAQLFKHYPSSPNPIAEPAVVLIDEIDLHLHPKWQRTIMAYLSERFVNTQFIVTAHSPLIVQSAENANIVVLKREGDAVKIHQHPQDVKGWRIDQLLTSDLFDIPSARSPHYENLLNQRRQLLSQSQLTDIDKIRLAELESQIGDLPTAESRQDIEAMDIIRRAAELLK